MSNTSYPEQIFRANDIRGIADKELTDDFVFALGVSFARRVLANGESQVMICCDARISSPRLHKTLIAALQSQNIEIIDLGIGPTPLLGFGLAQPDYTGSDETLSGIMITASHNPPDQNGFKIVLSGHIFFGDNLKLLLDDMNQETVQQARQGNKSINTALYKQIDLQEQYIQAVKDDIGDLSGVKVIIDGANGAAGPLAVKTLTALGVEVIEQFCELDGRFPNRSPDTSNPKNLKPLSDRVIAEKADIGIGFDGDGDRMVAVTETGRLINADEMILIFARSALENSPSSNIVYDVKCSTDVEKHIRELGGTPIMHRSGRSFIQEKMLSSNAVFAGEFSAHYFFQDRWCGTDDGIYAACRLLKLCKDANGSLEEICGSFPCFGQGSGKVASDEIYLNVPDSRKFEIINELAHQSNFEINGQQPKVVRIDGLRLEYSQGWALVRASNTSANLTLRFEADSEDFMVHLTKKIAEVLRRISNEIDTDGIHHVA